MRSGWRVRFSSRFRQISGLVMWYQFCLRMSLGKSKRHSERSLWDHNGQPLKWEPRSRNLASLQWGVPLLMDEVVTAVIHLSPYQIKNKHETCSIILLFLYVPVGGHGNNDWLLVLDSLAKIKCLSFWLKWELSMQKQQERTYSILLQKRLSILLKIATKKKSFLTKQRQT